jgi:hypothetical protein
LDPRYPLPLEEVDEAEAPEPDAALEEYAPTREEVAADAIAGMGF